MILFNRLIIYLRGNIKWEDSILLINNQMNQMNPITRTLIVIFLFCVLAFVINLIIGPKGGKNFIIVVYSFYLMPGISILAYAFFLIREKKWIKNNLFKAIIWGVLLFCWLLSILLYIYSLSA